MGYYLLDGEKSSDFYFFLFTLNLAIVDELFRFWGGEKVVGSNVVS